MNQMTKMTVFTTSMCKSAKWAFSTRRVNRDDVRGISTEFDQARAGDLLMCEITMVGQHKNIQLAERRSAQSYVGDLVVLCLGDRYAPDQFLSSAVIEDGNLALAAGGGVAGRVDAAHADMSKPTELRPIGLLTGDYGRILNVADYALPALPANHDITVIGVFGASMNAGKTTAAASIAHGLGRAGYKVAGIKATGTGAFGDFNAFEDGGTAALDFTDAGMATTYRMPLERIEQGFDTLVATAAKRGAQIAVVEIADGVFQPETRAILKSSRIRDRMDGILFATPDALGALGAVTWLENMGLSPFAISGKVSCSPLAAAEAAEVTGLPILSRTELRTPEAVLPLVKPIMRRTQTPAAA